MKHFIMILILFSIATCLSAQTQIEKLNHITNDLYSVFDTGRKPGCAIVVIKNGEKVYQNCFGLANIENEIAITDSTLFFLASVTKQFTGYGIAKLITERKLDYNAPISKYLPNENPLWDSIEIKHLIYQSSGIWDWPYLFLATGHSLDDVLDSKGIFQLIKGQSKLNFPAGSKFQYTSSNYMLLGEIVKRITGSNYYDWMKSSVLHPAGITNTVFQESHSAIINNRASGYVFKENKYYRTTNNLSPIGTGFIYANIEDMSKWMIFLLSEKSQATAQMLKTGKLDNGKNIPYAFGLMKRGEETYWHDGILQGFRTITILNPKANFALVLLSNSGSNFIVRSAFAVANMYLTDSIPTEEIEDYKKKFQNEPQRKSNPNEELIYNQNLTGLEGIYLNKELLITYKIFEKNDSLYVANSIEEILLKPLNNNKDKFVSDNDMLGDFIFERNQKGNVSGFLIKQRRDNIIKFTRIEKE
ncbi:MAG: serine hydrolase domain-containing protein [Mangrovibacterium sp.]